MKKFWSICFVGLVVICLQALGALPASAYYPPLPATITATPGGGTITFSVYNPKLDLSVSASYYYPPGVSIEGNPVQQNGVMAWITKYTSADVGGPVYGVGYAVYDPYLQDFKQGGEGPFTQEPEQLTVQDGVVAYLAVPPSETGPAYPVFHYATYNPIKEDWQNRTFTPMEEGTSGFTVYDRKLTLKDGIVLMEYKGDLTLGGSVFKNTYLYADVYAAWSGNGAGKWLSEVALSIYVWSEQAPLELRGAPIIDKATITVKWGPHDLPDITLSKKVGYDWWKEGDGWTPGPTKAIAYAAVQPTSGNNPLWVSFTDMSLGGASVDWSFGDGDTSTKRSEYHKYTQDGVYASQQKVTGTGTDVFNKNIYVGVQPPSWQTAYASLASADDLTLLRRYRDEVLSRDARGKVYREQLYDNSEAALTVLTDNPELLLRARNLVDANMGAVIQVLQGHEGYIYDPEAVLAFLESYEGLAPPQLKALINVVRKEMRQSQIEGKPFLGFRLGSNSSQDKNLSKPLKK